LFPDKQEYLLKVHDSSFAHQELQEQNNYLPNKTQLKWSPGLIAAYRLVQPTLTQTGDHRALCITRSTYARGVNAASRQ